MYYTHIELMREKRIEEWLFAIVYWKEIYLFKKNTVFPESIYSFKSYKSTIDGFADFDYQTTGLHAISVLN